VSEIVVVGGLNMDLHLFGLRGSTGQAPMVADEYLAMPGGKGGNVARALAQLDVPVRLIARVGDDEFGHDCVAAVAADGVDTGGVTITPDESTGFVAIELIEGSHQSILFAPGANDHLTWSDVRPAVEDLADGLVIAQAEIPTAVLDALCAFCSESEIPLFLDPTPPERVLRRHLEVSEVITPDALEAAELVGRVPGSHLWPALACRELLESGARRVIVKLGADGALLGDENGLTEVATIDVEPIDETGAGDTFLAALAARRLEGAPWLDAVRFANVAAALSVATSGLHLPDRAAIEAAELQLRT
jgi:ribokinase